VRVSLGLGPIGAGTQCAQSLVPAPIPTAGQPHSHAIYPCRPRKTRLQTAAGTREGGGKASVFFLDRFCLVSMLRAKRNRPLTLGKKRNNIRLLGHIRVFHSGQQPRGPYTEHNINWKHMADSLEVGGNCAHASPACVGTECPRQ
jgi:hypothetical protein